MAALIVAMPAHADPRHGGGSSRRGGDHYRGGGGGFGHRGGGRYYYYGGVPYFYPVTSFGFGDPYWYGGGFDVGYAGSVDSRYYGVLRPYNGRIVDESREPEVQRGARSLPGAVQRQLAQRGYYKGGIDGQFGPASKSALKRFQRDNDLKSSGLIDGPTLEALGFGER